MKYYLIAGEASGDLHASNLIKELKKKDTNAELRGWGGDLMQQEGVTLVKHYRSTAFMGILTVLRNLRTILANIKYCKQDILDWKPDVVVLVDYPGFNLRIAQFAKQHRIKVFYYIAPKVWAWKESRVKKIKATVDKLYSILPFEKTYFAQHGIEAFYGGNPLLDAIADRPFQQETFEQFCGNFNLQQKNIIALLAGSRKQEIKHMLPTMLEVCKDFPNYQFVLAGAPAIDDAFYQQYLQNAHTPVPIVRNETYRLLQQSTAALVASGTATLETALLEVPQVVCFNTAGGKIAYRFGQWLIRAKFISLVNLILDREAVKELIVIHFNRENLKNELQAILGGTEREKMLADYQDLKKQMGEKGVSARVAEKMFEDLHS